MLDDIVAHDIAQGISVPIPTTKNCLLSPWARIASRLRTHPAGLALLISEQTFQEQACIRRNTLLREQRTYPLLDLSKRRRPQRKRLLNRRGPRPRHPNHGCPWIQKPATIATVMLGALGYHPNPCGARGSQIDERKWLLFAVLRECSCVQVFATNVLGEIVVGFVRDVWCDKPRYAEGLSGYPVQRNLRLGQCGATRLQRDRIRG